MGPSSSLSFSDVTAFRHRPEIPVETNLRQRRDVEEPASDNGAMSAIEPERLKTPDPPLRPGGTPGDAWLLLWLPAELEPQRYGDKGLTFMLSLPQDKR